MIEYGAIANCLSISSVDRREGSFFSSVVQLLVQLVLFLNAAYAWITCVSVVFQSNLISLYDSPLICGKLYKFSVAVTRTTALAIFLAHMILIPLTYKRERWLEKVSELAGPVSIRLLITPLSNPDVSPSFTHNRTHLGLWRLFICGTSSHSK